jgi:4-hydroxybenzoate polyprenyltransferase
LAAATGMQWLYVGWSADLASIYYVGALASYSHLAWQVQTSDFDEPANLAARFRSNAWVGLSMFVSLAAGRFFA